MNLQKDVLKIKLEYIVKKENSGFMVKDILRNELKISNRLITKLKLANQIYVNDSTVFTTYIVSENDVLMVNIDFIEKDNLLPQKYDLEVLYEDEYILAVNKLANLVVHPCAYHPDNTLANYVKYYLNNQKIIRPINRLDNGTSGIVLFAKNEYIQERFSNMNMDKEYIAIVCGIRLSAKDTINLPIARKQGSIIEREVNEAGQPAITHYEVIKEFSGLTVLKVRLGTGRTHQIRVHFSHLGFPLLGDTLYGTKSDLIDRQALHAYRIRFVHPVTNNETEIIAPLPYDISHLLHLKL